MRPALAKLGYGTLFAVVLPVLLVLWTRAVPLPLPAFHVPGIGLPLAIAGLALMAAGIIALWRRGGGLPMNAFPPPRLVSTGIYRIVPHPIYVGFVVVCAGCALLFGSATGLWLTTPLTALGCLALVVGHERPDLDQRFGGDRPRAFLELPRAGESALTLGERLGSAALVLGLWILAYEGVKLLGLPPDAVDARLPQEATWPVWAWAEAVYFSTYLVVPAAFLLAPGRHALRRLGVAGLWATAVITLVYLLVPLVSPQRPVSGDGVWVWLLRLEHEWSQPPVAAFPSFHVVWAGLAAHALAARGRKWALIAWSWAVAIPVTCCATGMHAGIDVVMGMLLWLPFCRIEETWRLLNAGSQRLANSWRAWRLGPVRIINHALYPGIGAWIGMLGAGWLSGDLAGCGLVAAAALVGAGLWAQWVEGSPLLLRPFGFYGAILGGGAVLLLLSLRAPQGVQTAAAVATVAPWIQAIGRLRCLVQGCCHGRATAAARLGIRVREPHSRVCKIARLVDVPIHPTQLYSILANSALGAILARLWLLGAPAAFIGGLYLVLNGMARLMEEAYRGEPQTMTAAGLPLYQWLAIASVLIGMLLMVLPSSPVVPPAGQPSLGLILVAAATGLTCAFAMGVDFPEANRKFARLSG